MRWLGGLFVAVVALLLVGGDPAGANEVYQQQTGLPCGSCHRPNEELKGRDGLNSFGLAFLQCGHKLNCTPNPIAADTGHTSKNFVGVATLKDTCPNNQQMFVVVREGKNKANRDVPLVLDPGNHVQMGFDQGSTYTFQCGKLPTDRSHFFWVPLDKWDE